ncbi:hypothetical protein FOZ60_005076 [Perkinsus olseni]|uniref:Uncharacterized protein n=1 Tax=Perkinsus olseni TaxID=32597 RepID=A0A7J6NS13_PEROL|nr:hypothetical protein FOZ60_005076 [Perkinsus olseni]
MSSSSSSRPSEGSDAWQPGLGAFLRRKGIGVKERGGEGDVKLTEMTAEQQEEEARKKNREVLSRALSGTWESGYATLLMLSLRPWRLDKTCYSCETPTVATGVPEMHTAGTARPQFSGWCSQAETHDLSRVFFIECAEDVNAVLAARETLGRMIPPPTILQDRFNKVAKAFYVLDVDCTAL